MADLFAKETGSNLPDGFEYIPDFLTFEKHNSLYLALREADFWRQEPIRMFGKWVMQPRLTAYVADAGAGYAYAGAEQTVRPWTPELRELRLFLERFVASHPDGIAGPLNAVLLNAYRDGQDGMGWHRDNEPELGEEPLVVSVSLGASRRFSIKSRWGSERWDLVLEPGSLLLMHGRSQHDYLHALPKTTRHVGHRINLTFRRIEVGHGV